MARCEECLHYNLCQALEDNNDMKKVPPIYCGFYNNTADVVPKSEVEELKADLEVWKQNRFNIFQSLELYKMTRQEVAREILEKIESVMFDRFSNIMLGEDIRLCIAELKKKYTEGESNGSKQ